MGLALIFFRVFPKNGPATIIAGMLIINFLLILVTGQFYFLGIFYHDPIAPVKLRRIINLILAH